MRPFAHHKRLLHRAPTKVPTTSAKPLKWAAYLAIVERMKEYEKSARDPKRK